MTFIASITALTLLAAPASALSFGDFVPIGLPTGPIAVEADFIAGSGLFVDDVEGARLSVLLPLGADGGFDAGETTPADLLYFDATAELAAELVDVRYGPSSLAALFDVSENLFPDGAFGDRIVARFDFTGDVDFASAVDLTTLAGAQGTATLGTVAIVPLPAGLPPLVGALSLLALARRRRG